MDKIFVIKILLLWASEGAYERVDRKALRNILKIYGVGGQQMEGIKALYKEANAYVMVVL